MKILTFLRRKQAAIHWYFQRTTALVLLLMISWISFNILSIINTTQTISDLIHQLFALYPLSITLIIILSIWHSKTGIESILEDYVHHEKTKFLVYSSLQLLALLIIKSVCTYLFIL